MGIVRLSHLADRDLDEIRDFSAQHSPAAANRLLDSIFETLELLADHPFIGQTRDDILKNLRLFTVRDHVILYFPAVEGIHVARIVRGARDFPTLFRGE